MKFDLDVVSFWQQGDVVSHAVLFLLLSMSITSWTIIISKSVQLAWWQHASHRALESFWQAKKYCRWRRGFGAHGAVSFVG
jgi:biopolymer transport protein ExbB